METENAYKEISQMLSEIKSEDGESNVLELLSKLLDTKIELDNDQLYTDQFEDISIKIKKNGFYIKDSLKRESLLKYLDDFSKNIKSKKDLLKPPMNKAEGEGGGEGEGEGGGAEPENEGTPITQVNFVEDYYSLFNKISWAGIGFDEKTSFLLTNSIRNLSAKLQAGFLRFFGIIYGIEKDYYIVQASDYDSAEENKEGEKEEKDPRMENRKEDGVNQFAYFVTNDLTTEWIELPDVTPNQIIGSRLIRYSFTGDLNRNIYSNPYFNGQEKHYLRCQISRIYHGTKLVPTINHYNIEDPENPFKAFVLNEKPKPFKHEDLINLKTWIHYPPNILKQGRVSHFIEAPEDADPEEFKKKQIEMDPFEKRIKPITEDTLIQGASQISNIKIIPWKLTQYMEDNIYVNPYIKLLDEKAPDFDPAEQKENKCDYSLICLKSLIWPGAYNFYFEKNCYFFYFGNGLKFSDIPQKGSFVYKSFPVLPADLEDLPDQPEPTIPPKEPGEEEEEENKEGEEKKEENEEKQEKAEE